MASIFSFPSFIPLGNYITTGYNIQVSRSVNGAPSYFGPWVALTGYTNTPSNTDIYDALGTYFDLYRVQPIVTIGTNTGVGLDFSRPFFKWQSLYDGQISVLIDHFRQNFIKDIGIPMTDSSIPTESTGAGTLPFLTDASTTRFYLSFLPNSDPIKFIAENALVYSGATKATAAPLVPYTDYFPNGDNGYIDFPSPPPANNYLRIEYKHVDKSNDEIRNVLINAVSSLSHYGINGYQVNSSNNLLYLVTPLPNRDLAELVCNIGQLNYLTSEVVSNISASEAWKNGDVSYTADPSRSLQAAAGAIPDIKEIIRNKSNNYILNNRHYIARGEYESFFDVTGLLPVYSLFLSQINSFSYWL